MTDKNSAKGHFSEVPSQANFPGLEEELLQFWDREKSLSAPSKSALKRSASRFTMALPLRAACLTTDICWRPS